MLKPSKPTISTYCANTTCLEVTAGDHGVRVRDTKDGGGSTTFTTAAWRLFAAAVGRGEFDE